MPPLPSLVRFGVFEADLRTKELRKNGMRLRLQGQPFQILELLLARPGELVTREEICQQLWPKDTFVDFDHSLNSAVKKLREALSDSATSPRFVETLAKRGYRFIGAVEVDSFESAQSQAPPIESGVEAQISPDPTLGVQASQTQTLPVQVALDPRDHGELPKVSRGTGRMLLALLQLMYLGFYVALLAAMHIVHMRLGVLGVQGEWIFWIALFSAVAGIPLRIYLLTAISLDYHRMEEKYRRLRTILFALDLLWAFSPSLIGNIIGAGLTLAAIAPLLFSPFAQRVLIAATYGEENGRTPGLIPE